MFDKGTAKNLLLECVGIFEAIRLSYFLSYGTALGAYRDKGFTPTEVDIDFGFMIEEFIPKVAMLAESLISFGYEVQTLHGHFTRPYILIAKKDNIKVDMVALIPWDDQVLGGGPVRFEPSLAGPFSGVYPDKLFRSGCQFTSKVFGINFYVPYPVEDYLLHLYGSGWKTPAKIADHTHQHRVPRFLETRGIPKGLLEQYYAPTV